RAAMPQLHQAAPATLGDEERLVRAYLELMLMRMPDRLAFTVEIEPALRTLPFPQMGLLTLVENAIRHGIDPGCDTARIDVGAHRDAAGTGVHLIMGCGYYVNDYQDARNHGRTVEDFAAEMAGQILSGAWGTDVRAGMIGEIGCTAPWTDLEKRVMRAAFIAAAETGAAINVHPGRDPDQPQEVADFAKSVGHPTERMVISHIDRTIFDETRLLRLADSGVTIEFDLFGQEECRIRPSDRSGPGGISPSCAGAVPQQSDHQCDGRRKLDGVRAAIDPALLHGGICRGDCSATHPPPRHSLSCGIANARPVLQRAIGKAPNFLRRRLVRRVH
ncbi:hypothetical protein HYR69_11090, partial [Candidatus Sumerlaeota bacterium]|nr:hypothetical protein [Candidatus Sumerlaeota bacterium]